MQKLRVITTLLVMILACLLAAVPAEAADGYWNTDQVLSQQGDYPYAGIYEFDNLTIGDNVEITSSGISQLVIKVNGTFTIGENVVIRVRNGYYPDAPANSITDLTPENLLSLGQDAGGFRLYPNMFGRGGDGGEGAYHKYGTGGDGGGGYGGGQGGEGNGGDGAPGTGGSDAPPATGGEGGGATGLGTAGTSGPEVWGYKDASGGGGGGGNGGNGGKGIAILSIPTCTGKGGGGGGYGGGILTLVADHVEYDPANPPRFLVSGQRRGLKGSSGGEGGADGQNGEGGLVVIQGTPSLYIYRGIMLDTDTYGVHKSNATNGGHGIVTGNPQNVFVNGDYPVDATEIVLDKRSLTLTAGGAAGNISATVLPDDAASKTVAYISDNPSVATVDADGVVIPLSVGTAIITGTALGGDGFSQTCTVLVKESVSGIDLDKSTMTLRAGGATGKITAIITPEDAVNSKVNWISSNIQVASVDDNGVVTPLTTGTATITATTDDGGFSKQCTVTVLAPAEGVELNKDNLTLRVEGSTYQLKANVLPVDATNKDVIWSSSNSDVAVVNAQGVVTPVAVGNSVITVTTDYGAYTASCIVTVKPPAEGVELDKTTLTLRIDGTAGVLTATVLPVSATNKTVYWNSSNPDVATVSSDGVVTPVMVGNSVITVTTDYGGFTASCVVTVKPPAEGVQLDKSSLNLRLGGTPQRLVATVLPNDATNKKVIWNSANPDIATVDTVGVVTPQGVGTVVITVITDFCGYTDECVVIVSAPSEGVELNKYELTLRVGGSTAQLVATVIPPDATNRNVSWSSNNSTVAMVDSNGIVTPVSVGDCTITATTEYGGYKAECTVTVKAPTEGIQLNKERLTLRAGGATGLLIANILPADATNKKVIWSSSNPELAEVNTNGVITPKSPGKAVITATTEYGGFTAQCSLFILPTQISSITPSWNCSDVNVDANIKVVFNRQMDENSINGSTFYLKLGGDLIPATIKYTPSTLTLQLTPVESMRNQSVYTVMLSHLIQDANKNTLGETSDADVAWTFTTAASAFPGVSTTSPWPMYMHDAGHSGSTGNTITGSGELSWKVNNGATNQSPVIGEGNIIYTPACTALWSLNPDGSRRWTYITGNNTVNSSPLIAGDGTIYFTAGGYLYAVRDDDSTATFLWKADLQAIADRPFSPVADSNGNVYISMVLKAMTDTGQIVYVSNLCSVKSGVVNWSREFDQEIKSAPVVGSDGVIYAAAGNTVYALAANGEELWSLDAATSSTISSLALDEEGRIYAASSGTLQLILPGGSAYWNVSPGGTLTAPVHTADGSIMVGSSDGHIYIYSPDGTLLSNIAVNAPVITPPVADAVGNMVFSSTGSMLYSYKQDGTLRWSYKTTGATVTAPAAVGKGGTVYVNGSDGCLYAIGGAGLELVPGREKASVNSTVYCAVNVSGVSDLCGTDLSLSFDPAVLEISGVSTGSFFDNALSPFDSDSQAAEWVTGACYEYNNSKGLINIAGSKTAGTGFSGSTTLATLSFNIIDKGISIISIDSATLLDSDARPLAVCTTDTAVVGSIGSIINGRLAPEGNPDYSDFTVILEDDTLIGISEIKPESDWSFVFTEIAPGSYCLSAYSPGYLRERLSDITVSVDNTTVDTELMLLRSGDVDQSNSIDLMDLVIFVKSFSTVSGDAKWNPDADLNRDNRINIIDLAYLARNYGLEGAAVPE